MSPIIRSAVSADLEAVAAIYGNEALTGYATFDTTPPPIEAWQQKLDSTDPGDFFLVAADDSGVLGFAYSSVYRPRPAYDRTRETTVYLAPGAQGQRLGTRLYAELFDRMRAAGVHVAIAGIALPNEGSERLHRAAGFTEVGRLVEVGHKFGRWIDVGFFQATLTPGSSA
jgi:L-amino acid N-acyltransferase YncA